MVNQIQMNSYKTYRRVSPDLETNVFKLLVINELLLLILQLSHEI